MPIVRMRRASRTPGMNRSKDDETSVATGPGVVRALVEALRVDAVARAVLPVAFPRDDDVALVLAGDDGERLVKARERVGAQLPGRLR